MDAAHQLKEIYIQNPCRTLPNALWKTLDQGDELQVDLQRDDSGKLTSLAVWQGDRLSALWCEDVRNPPLSSQEINQVPFALVHSKALPIFEHRQFTHQEAFFRLIHNDSPPVYSCPPGFTYREVNPDTEMDAVAGFIQLCYENLNVNQSIVRGWLTHPVHQPTLWVWIVDEVVNRPTALGIAELDDSVPEASLEWVQVLPAYRGNGLGKAVVAELLRRISDTGGFTTVSGKINNPTHPENLYRRCGFSGRDVWWLLMS